MIDYLNMGFSIFAGVTLPLFAYLVYIVFIQPRFNPLRNLPGPPSRGIFHDQLGAVMK